MATDDTTIFIELLKVAKEVDENADILPWYQEDGTKKLGVRKGKEDRIPKTGAALSPYFFNMQPNRVGKKWLKIRITSFHLKQVEEALGKWARAESYNFSRCVVQTEKECVIGWLVYSSQYTDTEYLGRCLTEKTKHEWGFRLGAVTEKDMFENGDESAGKKTPWKDRVKAIFVHVPLEHQMTATQVIGEWLEPNKFFIPSRIPSFKDRLLFTPPEREMCTNHDEAIKYSKLVEKQSDHNDGLRAHLCVNIIADIDKKIKVRSGRTLTLRQMILSIKAHNKGPTKGMNLFQSIDFTPNATKLYFGGRQGPRCSGNVITFYELVQGEAIQMIRGLGVYLLRMYGSEGIRSCFSKKYWDAMVGWKWSKTYECFDRPETRQLHSNVNHDPNDMVKLMGRLRIEREKLEKLQKKAKEEEEKDEAVETEGRMRRAMQEEQVTTTGRTTEATRVIFDTQEDQERSRDDSKSIVTSVSQVIQKNEIEQIRKVDDKDLDSVGDELVVSEIEDDNVSIASSLTANTGNTTNREHDDEVSMISMDSQETFGQETIERHTNRDTSGNPKSEGQKHAGSNIFKKFVQAGSTREEIIEKAQIYIPRKATRDFQESTAAYQAALDDVLSKLPIPTILQSDEKSAVSNSSQLTSPSFQNLKSPTSSDNAGQPS